MKINRFWFWYLGMMVATGLLFGLSYRFLPETMASHWGIDGRPDGFSSKDTNMIIFGAMYLLMGVVYAVVKKVEPKKANLEKSREAYDGIILMVVGFLSYMMSLVVLFNLGIVSDMTRMLMGGFAVLFAVIGLLMPKTEQTFSVGVRTPWTLSSTLVWKKTHKMTGGLFVLIGVLALISTAFPSWVGFGVIVGGSLFVVLMSYVYSYWLYRKEEKKK